MTPQEICTRLQADGYRAVLDEDEDVAHIKTGVDGIPFSIHLYRPSPPDGDLDAFDSVSFSAGIEQDEPNLMRLNSVNAQGRFIKVYAENGVIWFEMDNIVKTYQLTPELWEEVFGMWTACLANIVQDAVN